MAAAYENLVFEGGGVKGIAYAGVLNALDCFGVLPGVQNVAGTSAGAITACLLSVGYTAHEITERIFALNFKQFKDGWDPLRLLTKYGLYCGDKFLDWITDRIGEKIVTKEAITFKVLEEFRQKEPGKYKKLNVFATDLNTNNIQRFCYEYTPDVVVAEAVRASMSIPLFFKSWKFRHTENTCIKHHIFVDGGVLYNYPIDIFDKQDQTTGLKIHNDATLGFCFKALTEPCGPANSLDFDEPFYYSKNLFETILNAQIVDFNKDPQEVSRSVQIDDMGIMATDFDITKHQMNELYCNGYHSTMCFLEGPYSKVRNQESCPPASAIQCPAVPCPPTKQ